MKEVIRLFSGLLLLAVCLSQWPNTQGLDYKTDVELLKAIVNAEPRKKEHTPIQTSAAMASDMHRERRRIVIEPSNFAYARLDNDFAYSEPQIP